VSYQWAIELAPSIATVCAAALGLVRGQGRLRRNLRHDVETANLLPEGSDSRAALMTYVHWEIDQLRQREKDGRRDWSGFALGLIFALVFGYATVAIYRHPDWWRWFAIPTGVLACIGLFGIADGLSIQKREDRTSRRRRKQLAPTPEPSEP
jgi:hypothetical protein